MNSFRKHADVKTSRSETGSGNRFARRTLFPRLAAFAVTLFFIVALSSNASAQSPGGAAAQAKAPAQAEQSAAGRVRMTEHAALLDAMPDAPMRIHLAGTADSPVVVATIGDFAKDLGEDGKLFLRREFIEHFVANVLELGGPAHAAPMLSFLSQTEENERDGTFKIGGVSGRISVLVTPRRVFVMCSFAEDEQDTRNLAAIKAALEGSA